MPCFTKFYHIQLTMVINFLFFMPYRISSTQTIKNDTNNFCISITKQKFQSILVSFLYTLYIAMCLCNVERASKLEAEGFKSWFCHWLALLSGITLNLTKLQLPPISNGNGELSEIMQAKYLTNCKMLHKYKILQIDNVYLFLRQVYFFELCKKLSKIFHFWH